MSRLMSLRGKKFRLLSSPCPRHGNHGWSSISIGRYGANRWLSAIGEVYQICSNVVRPRRRPSVVAAVRTAGVELVGIDRWSGGQQIARDQQFGWSRVDRRGRLTRLVPLVHGFDGLVVDGRDRRAGCARQVELELSELARRRACLEHVSPERGREKLHVVCTGRER